MNYFFPQRRLQQRRRRRGGNNLPIRNVDLFDMQIADAPGGNLQIDGNMNNDQLRLILMREIVARELVRRMRLQLGNIDYEDML